METLSRILGFFEGWRGLGRFWLITAGVLALACGIAQVMGPPEPRPRIAAAPKATPADKPAAIAQPVVARPSTHETAVPRPGRDTPGPINDPDPALLEPVAGSRTDLLPVIARDGRRPDQVYAAGFDQATKRARVGVILAGIGLSESDSIDAIRQLPGGVTLAVSPYSPNPDRILAAARSAEHEYLLPLPMEPTLFPIADPGPQAMMTSLAPEQNLQRLHWAMSRVRGYVGATNALGTMYGERFAELIDQIGMVMGELDRRGLIYVDARAGKAAPKGIWGRSVDIILDDDLDRNEIDSRLDELARVALDRGAALGLAGVPRPVTVQRIAAWSASLLNKGLALAPASAIALAAKESK